MPILVCRTREELQTALQAARDDGKRIGYVPTMGALHAGHLSLVTLAQEKCGFVVVSIFVNPTQFAPHEDFDQYPRMPEDDTRQLDAAGVDVVFLPDEGVIYPDGKDSKIKAGAAAAGLESDFRPHFFDGVVNVVHRLFSLVKPDVAVFGEKDFQQFQVIREMVATLDLPVHVVGAQIMRDEQGLALSSRNAYLSADELVCARKLNKILQEASSSRDEKAAAQALLDAGFDKIDYVTVKPQWNRILAAAWLGKTRLIDNFPL